MAVPAIEGLDRQAESFSLLGSPSVDLRDGRSRCLRPQSRIGFGHVANDRAF